MYKRQVFDLEEKKVTLLDTPGHVDFSAEMERTLQVLDYAVLVISGADGVQAVSYTHLDVYKRQLADYLNVDRSTMCNELSKMQKDGMIEYKKNRILLKD